jgi:hypothetical protein
MKITPLLQLLAGSALATTLLSGQTAGADSAAAMEPAAKPVSGWTTSFSADYFNFTSKWEKFDQVRRFWGPSIRFSGEDQREGDFWGGTVSFAKQRTAIDFSFRQGDSSIDMLNTSILSNVDGVTYVDTMKFDEKFYDLRLRYNLGDIRGFASYLSAGIAYGTIRYDYSFVQFDYPASVSTPPRTRVPPLSGEAKNYYGSLGLGFTTNYKLGERSFFFPKVEAALLGGKPEESFLGTGFAADNKFSYGVETSITGRFSWLTGETSSLALEGGGKARYLSGDNIAAGVAYGFFVKAALSFSY